MSKKILPCPFCGSKPKSMRLGEGGRALMIHCIANDCPNPGVSYYGDGVAIGVWNRRAPPSDRMSSTDG